MNTGPCHSLSRGTLFRQFETAASTPSKPAATFRAPAHASPPASKPSPNFSSPRSKFPASPKPPFCPLPLAQAPPAPPRFSRRLGRFPLDTRSSGQLTIPPSYIRVLYVRESPMIGTGIKRGTAELAVLSVLEHGPLHGYEMARRIEQQTKG